MRSRLLLIAAVATGLALTGCATPSTGPSTPPDPSPSASEVAEPQPEALVISLDSLAYVNDDASVISSADFTDGAAVLALLGTAFGSTPEGVENTDGYPITSYEWGDVVLNVITDAGASISVGVATYGGLEIRTDEGIAVGASRDDVTDLDTYDSGWDADADGQSDYLGLQPQTNPDVESLERPGQPGTQFILVQFEGDTVSRINSPADDYSDL